MGSAWQTAISGHVDFSCLVPYGIWQQMGCIQTCKLIYAVFYMIFAWILLLPCRDWYVVLVVAKLWLRWKKGNLCCSVCRSLVGSTGLLLLLGAGVLGACAGLARGRVGLARATFRFCFVQIQRLLSVRHASSKSSMLSWSRVWWCARGVLLKQGWLFTSVPTSHSMRVHMWWVDFTRVGLI